MGDDIPSVFFEYSRIRTHAKRIAKILVNKLDTRRVKQAEAKIKAGDAPDQHDIFEFMFLLRCKHEMGMGCGAMLRLASISFKEDGFSDTDALLGVDGLENIDTDNWLLVLMRVLIMDYNNILFHNKFPMHAGLCVCFCETPTWTIYHPPSFCQWCLKECFEAIREHELADRKSDGPDEYDNAFYLATHIVFATGLLTTVIQFHPSTIRFLSHWLIQSLNHASTYLPAYSTHTLTHSLTYSLARNHRSAVSQKDVPWLYSYIRGLG